MSDQIDTDIPPANPTNEQSTLDLILQEIRSLKDRLSIVENNQKAFYQIKLENRRIINRLSKGRRTN